MSRTDSGCCDISAIPPALSAIGPKLFIARIYTADESIPIVATAVPNNPALLLVPTPEVDPKW
jgi:hypothetical protein